MEQVAEAIKFFEKDIRSAGIPEEQANPAKYILCATADDIVQNIPTEDRHVWTQYSMLSRFFGERIGGVRFFEELDALKDPLVNYPLLELQHACLALGFQGIHRTSPGGRSSLQQIQRNLYETLRRIRPKVDPRSVAALAGPGLASRASRLRVPVWAVASVPACCCSRSSSRCGTCSAAAPTRVAGAIATLHPTDKIDDRAPRHRAAAAPAAPPAGPTDAAAAHRRELARRMHHRRRRPANVIIIRLGDVALFDSGKADGARGVQADRGADRAARSSRSPASSRSSAIPTTTPIKTVRFPSN